jgi:hypothetical protein
MKLTSPNSTVSTPPPNVVVPCLERVAVVVKLIKEGLHHRRLNSSSNLSQES